MLDCVSVFITTEEDCWIVVETFGFFLKIWSASAVTENVEKMSIPSNTRLYKLAFLKAMYLCQVYCMSVLFVPVC